MDLPIKVIPPATSHTHTVIFLHGRGSTAENFATEITVSLDSKNRTLVDIFPTARWVFPGAPIGPVGQFPGQRMSQWFDIWNVSDFADREELQAVGLRDSVAAVRRVVQREVEKLGGRWDRVVLAGLSQGGATAVHTFLNLSFPARRPHEMDVDMPPRLGALVGFCCRMPFPGRSLADTRRVLGLERLDDDNILIRSTPVLLSHCADDPLVLVRNGQQLRDTLQGFGANVTWKEYPDGGHWINSPAGVDDAAEFLRVHVFERADSE